MSGCGGECWVAASMKYGSRDKMKPMQSSKKFLFGFNFSGLVETIYHAIVTELCMFA